MYIEAEQVLSETVGREHMDYAQTISNHANSHSKMNAHDDAERLYLTAGYVYAKVLGEDHPQHVRTLNNLAVVYAILVAVSDPSREHGACGA